jgi:formylglycine-generating enzyme required for sulfatase activity
MLAGQEEMLPILRRMVGVCDYVDELRGAGCSGEQFAQFLERFNHAYTAFAARQYRDAERLLTEAAAEQPQSAAVAVALAATQTAECQFVRAEVSLGRAVRLRPHDADLVELHRRVTVLSHRGNTPQDLPPAGPGPMQPGDVLDGWTLEQLLGRGGWGQVWKAVKASRRAALKVMHPELARDPSFVERFTSEILSLARLDRHANLVKIETFGFGRDMPYLVMEFVEGATLENHLARHGALSWDSAHRLFEGLADGLRTAHARGIVHRDIKPANVLLRPDGSGVLVDFGLAGLTDSSGKTARAGYTPLFAAPEQLRSGQADTRSDVFSLAATLHYALLYNDAARREPHCFKAALVPAAVRTLLTRSLDNHPAERPADAAEFLAGLRHDPAAEQRLVTLYEEILDRGQGKPTDADKRALGELCRKHGIPTERANAVLREVHARWHAAHPPRKEPSAGDLIQNSLGMKFAWCPPGTFMMGSPSSEAERGDDESQHRVTLTKGFYLGIHAVTQAQWRAVMGSNPSNFKGDHLPVEQVSWDMCQEFCPKLGQKDGKRYRLPTEAEWEYACRAGTTTPFYFGETISTDQVNYDGNHPYGKGKQGPYRQKTTAVGSFPPNAWGLHDMHGNVLEWCQDWYGPYPAGNIVDPQGDGEGEARVLRGGSWDDSARICRLACRRRSAPGVLSNRVGCRVVLCLD